MKIKYLLFFILLLCFGCNNNEEQYRIKQSIKTGFYCVHHNVRYFITIDHGKSNDSIAINNVDNNTGNGYEISDVLPKEGDNIEIISHYIKTTGVVVLITNNWIVTTAYVEPGMSGSPMLFNGKVIAVVARKIIIEGDKEFSGCVILKKQYINDNF